MILDGQHTAPNEHYGEFRYSFQDNILYGVDNPENISENFLQVLEIRNTLKH